MVEITIFLPKYIEQSTKVYTAFLCVRLLTIYVLKLVVPLGVPVPDLGFIAAINFIGKP